MWITASERYTIHSVGAGGSQRNREGNIYIILYDNLYGDWYKIKKVVVKGKKYLVQIKQITESEAYGDGKITPVTY